MQSSSTQQQGTPPQEPPGSFVFKHRRTVGFTLIAIASLLVTVSGLLIAPSFSVSSTPTSYPHSNVSNIKKQPLPTPTPTFDPTIGAVLPSHRIVAFYAVPGAEVTGPAFNTSAEMLGQLKQQASAYDALDSAHPVQPGIDLVVSVPDGFPGPDHTYSHHVDAQTIQSYIDFCQTNNLLLFLDLNFGQAPVIDEVKFFLPYLQHYSFVHMAIDPEWMFPHHDGIPGADLSNVRAADLNPIIDALTTIPMQYHVPRKILIIHQYRGDGDGLTDPTNRGQAEIADKRNIHFDPRVDVVIHVDSVGGYNGDHEDKKQEYTQWVKDDMQKYQNFLYGGFKLFYKIESKTGVMTPQEVLALDPPPLVITYGN